MNYADELAKARAWAITVDPTPPASSLTAAFARLGELTLFVRHMDGDAKERAAIADELNRAIAAAIEQATVLMSCNLALGERVAALQAEIAAMR